VKVDVQVVATPVQVLVTEKVTVTVWAFALQISGAAGALFVIVPPQPPEVVAEASQVL
jgi:H+/gluconate symporter-like permease